MLCNHYKAGGGYITSTDLTTWLSGITSDHTTVVIEACHSGAFLPDLKGLSNQLVLLSSGVNQSSFADIDPPTDPNPGDAGSETIWGFVEAFGTGAADQVDPTTGLRDGEISFAEAVRYADDMDATPTTQHQSVTWPAALEMADVPYLSEESILPATLQIVHGAYAQQTATNAIGVTISKVQRCRANTLAFEVANAGSKRLAVGAVRLHVIGPQGGGPADWDYADTVILPAVGSSTTTSFTLEWWVGRHLQSGDQLTLVTSVDSPQAPVANHPAQTKESAAMVVNPPTTVGPCGCRPLQCP